MIKNSTRDLRKQHRPSGIDEIYIFIKFIICTNNEYNFIKIDGNETRFWVRKIPPIKQEETDFLEKLIAEIPAFLSYLGNRKVSTIQSTRMWFSHNQLFTPALKKLVNNNRNRVEKELASLLLSAMDKFELSEIQLCPMDALHMLNKTRVKTDLTQLRRLLKKEWKLENQKNSNSYQRATIWNNGEINLEDAKGRYFSISKHFLLKNFDEMMTS